MNGHEWCHETICRVLFFPESYATSQSACSEGLLGTFSDVKGNHSQKRHIEKVFGLFKLFLSRLFQPA